MSLRDRLRRLEDRSGRGIPSRPPGDGSVASNENGKETTTGSAARPAASHDPGLVHSSGGEETIARPSGVTEEKGDAVTVRVTRYPIAARHGRHAFSEIGEVCHHRLGLLSKTGEPFDPRDAVFLDTETSDLASGASVYVFMVGLLFVEGDEVVAEQIFLDGPEGEPRFLELVAKSVSKRSKIVSFAGKSFDRHRLDDRFALLAGERPFVEMPHLDLYHLGRRLYVRRMKDTRLRTFEEQLLGVRRVDDLGGAECPEAWFDYLEGFDDGRIERVFEHNLIDILSLLTLLVSLDRAVATPRDAIEASRAGLLLEEAGGKELAEIRYRGALDGLSVDRYRIDRDHKKALLSYAKMRRKERDGEGALEILTRLSAAIPDDAEPFLIASRVAERDLKDRPRALRFAYEHRRRLLSSRGEVRRADQLVEAARRIHRLGGEVTS